MNFLSYLISGISLGSVYALIALGYTMVYGIAKMLNFAHGDVIMIGGFVIFTAVSSIGIPHAGVAIVCRDHRLHGTGRFHRKNRL